MADKTIGDLTQAESIGSEDLFVLEQNSEAKKLKGSQLVKYAQDAVGAQVTAATQSAENAAAAKTGAESAQTQAQAARDAILNMLVEAITLESGLPATVDKSIVDSVYKLTFGLPKGEKGAKGDTGPANTLAIGTVTKGTEAAATITGDAPNQTLNLVLPRGEQGPQGIQGKTGATGNGIASIALKSGTHAAGTTDTYEITFTDGTTFDFFVYNGANGTGAGDMTQAVYDPQGKAQDIFSYADAKYSKPAGGIPKTDLASDVQTSLGKADSALQSVSKSDVGLGNVANERQYSSENPPPYPVTSVNGKTGAVTVSVPTVPSTTSLIKGNGSGGLAAATAGTDYAMVPTTRKVTLTASGWNSSTKQQTVTCSGVLSDATQQLLIPTPVNTAAGNPYDEASIQMVAQGANSVTFHAETVPTVGIDVYVTIYPINYLG